MQEAKNSSIVQSMVQRQESRKGTSGLSVQSQLMHLLIFPRTIIMWTIAWVKFREQQALMPGNSLK